MDGHFYFFVGVEDGVFLDDFLFSATDLRILCSVDAFVHAYEDLD